jgi:predicted DNA-binding protein with PD1-like motif
MPSRLWALIVVPLAAGCSASPPLAPAASALDADASPMTVRVLRLHPGDDLKASLEAYVRERRLEAVVVLTCVGSLERAVFRAADRPEGRSIDQRFEIVSLVGTLSASSGSHLHVSLTDSNGGATGGHLLDGSRIYTTAEVALGELPRLSFTRVKDPTYGYAELVPVRAP